MAEVRRRAFSLATDQEMQDSVPVLFDAWVLRPAGLVSVVGGFLRFVAIFFGGHGQKPGGATSRASRQT